MKNNIVESLVKILAIIGTYERNISIICPICKVKLEWKNRDKFKHKLNDCFSLESICSVCKSHFIITQYGKIIGIRNNYINKDLKSVKNDK